MPSGISKSAYADFFYCSMKMSNFKISDLLTFVKRVLFRLAELVQDNNNSLLKISK